MSPYECPRHRPPPCLPAPGRAVAGSADRPAAADPRPAAAQPRQLARAYRPLILGPADQPIATLNRYSLLYKSDNRGFYLVVRSQWQLLKPLQEGDKVRVELLNDKGVRIDQLSQAVDKRQKCRKERCTLSLNSALRAPTTPWTAATSCASGCCWQTGRRAPNTARSSRPCRSAVSTSST